MSVALTIDDIINFPAGSLFRGSDGYHYLLILDGPTTTYDLYRVGDCGDLEWEYAYGDHENMTFSWLMNLSPIKT